MSRPEGCEQTGRLRNSEFAQLRKYSCCTMKVQDSRVTEHSTRIQAQGVQLHQCEVVSFRCCGKHIQCFPECGASGSATAARTSGPCAKVSCRTPILNKQFHSCRSNQQVNCLTLRRVQRYLSASGSDLPKTTLPCQAGHANPGVGWSKPRTAHGSWDGIADATRAPCGLNEDFAENVCSDVGPLSSLSHFLAVLSRQRQVSASN